MWPWYNWLFVGGIVVLLLGYKIYKDKTMT